MAMQQTTSTARSVCDALLADYESLWHCLDELFASMTPADWARRHGKDWRYADVPYHLAYFDRDIVIRPIERGADVPPGEQRVLRSMAELNDWNAQRFAQRPGSQTVEQSLGQMRASREGIRRLLSTLRDADLDRKAFVELPGAGWTRVGTVLTMGCGHTWSELTALRLRMKRETPLPIPSATHRAIAMYMGFLPLFVNREQEAKATLTAILDFTGPGGGAWTIRVANGRTTVTEGRSTSADLTVTQSPDTFIKTRDKMHNPMVAMLTGKMKVRGFGKLGTFGKLFPPPSPGMTFDVPGGAAVAS